MFRSDGDGPSHGLAAQEMMDWTSPLWSSEGISERVFHGGLMGKSHRITAIEAMTVSGPPETSKIIQFHRHSA